MPSGTLSSADDDALGQQLADDLRRARRRAPCGSTSRATRLEARASIRLATLKQAISSTIVTAPIIVRMIGVTSSGRSPSCGIGRTQAPQPSLVAGKRRGQVRGDRVGLLLRLLERDAVAQAAEHLEAALRRAAG